MHREGPGGARSTLKAQGPPCASARGGGLRPGVARRRAAQASCRGEAQGSSFGHAAARAVRAPCAREPPTRREAAAHGSRCAARLAVSSRGCAASPSVSRVRDGVSRGWATALLGRPGLRPGRAGAPWALWRSGRAGPLSGGAAVGRGRCGLFRGQAPVSTGEAHRPAGPGWDRNRSCWA